MRSRREYAVRMREFTVVGDYGKVEGCPILLRGMALNANFHEVEDGDMSLAPTPSGRKSFAIHGFVLDEDEDVEDSEIVVIDGSAVRVLIEDSKVGRRL